MITKRMKNNINNWLRDKVNKWFYDLDEDNKLDVVEGIYPNEIGLVDSSELWEMTEFKTKLAVWKENK